MAAGKARRAAPVGKGGQRGRREHMLAHAGWAAVRVDCCSRVEEQEALQVVEAVEAWWCAHALGSFLDRIVAVSRATKRHGKDLKKLTWLRCSYRRVTLNPPPSTSTPPPLYLCPLLEQRPPPLVSVSLRPAPDPPPSRSRVSPGRGRRTPRLVCRVYSIRVHDGRGPRNLGKHARAALFHKEEAAARRVLWHFCFFLLPLVAGGRFTRAREESMNEEK